MQTKEETHKTYTDYINHSKEWGVKRQETFALKGRECERCQSTKELNVHHGTYARLYYEVVETDLFVLCRECHDLYHSIIKGSTSIKKTKLFISGVVILERERKGKKHKVQRKKKVKKFKTHKNYKPGDIARIRESALTEKNNNLDRMLYKGKVDSSYYQQAKKINEIPLPTPKKSKGKTFFKVVLKV